MAYAPVELTIIIQGPSDEVLAAVRNLRSRDGLTISATVNAATIFPENRRQYERTTLPRIEEGDASAAQHKLDALVRQRLIDAEVERRVDEVIALARELTR